MLGRAAVSGCIALAACSFDTSGVGSADGSAGVLDASSGPPAIETTGALDDTGTSSGGLIEEGSATTTTADPPAESSDDGNTESTGGDPCAICAPEATCVIDDGEAHCTCPDAHEGDGQQCSPIPALALLRAELACGIVDVGSTCGTAGDSTAESKMTGAPGTIYDVELRIRAIVEVKRYTGGGVPEGTWLPGGGFGLDGDSAATLTISDPGQTYRLNADPDAGGMPRILDYVRTVPVATGATVQLQLASIDFFQLENPGLDIPEVPPDGAFDGQFVQIDIESIAAR